MTLKVSQPTVVWQGKAGDSEVRVVIDTDLQFHFEAIHLDALRKPSWVTADDATLRAVRHAFMLSLVETIVTQPQPQAPASAKEILQRAEDFMSAPLTVPNLRKP